MKSQEITIAQDIFVQSLLDGDGAPQAAKKAGYNPTGASRILNGVCVNSKLRAHARVLLRGKIDLEGSPEAYRVLMYLMRAPDTPIGMKIDIAKFLVNHAVPAPKAPEEGQDNEKEPSEMSDRELYDLIKRTDAELMQRGQLIDATPSYRVDDVI